MKQAVDNTVISASATLAYCFENLPSICPLEAYLEYMGLALTEEKAKLTEPLEARILQHMMAWGRGSEKTDLRFIYLAGAFSYQYYIIVPQH